MATRLKDACEWRVHAIPQAVSEAYIHALRQKLQRKKLDKNTKKELGTATTS